MNRAVLIAKKETTHVDAYILISGDLQEHLDIPLAEVKTLLGEGTVIFVFPSEWVSFIDIILPEVKPSLLNMVIPNLIEEFLAEPIESVHWAIAQERQSKDGRTTVAVTNRSHIENTIGMCKTAGITLEALYPDIYLLPIIENGWACSIANNRMCVRQDSLHGFVLLKSESANWFASVPVPEKTILYGEGEGLQSFLMKDWVTPLFHQAPPINMLQGEFSVQLKKTDPNRLKKSLYVLGGALICYFLFLSCETLILSHRLNTLQAETLSLYQEVIPGATQATSPRVVIEREMQRVGARDHTFFLLLSTLSQALSRSPGIILFHLQYEGDELSATVEAADFATLDAWTQSFSQDQLVFKQESAEQENGKVRARIRLEE